jgi:hypothetical protein
LESLKERDHSEELNVYGSSNINMDLGKRSWRRFLDSSGLGQGPVWGSRQDGNEPSGSIRDLCSLVLVFSVTIQLQQLWSEKTTIYTTAEFYSPQPAESHKHKSSF